MGYSSWGITCKVKRSQSIVLQACARKKSVTEQLVYEERKSVKLVNAGVKKAAYIAICLQTCGTDTLQNCGRFLQVQTEVEREFRQNYYR